MKITLRNMRTTLDELSSMNVNIQPLANSYVKFKWDHNTSWESYKEIVRKLGELDASNTAPCLTKVTLNPAFAGQECHLLVQTVDYNIRPKLAGGDKISVTILSSEGKSLVTTIMDKKNGLYEVLYVPPAPGNYELMVNVLDQTVARKDVPLTIHVGALRHTKFPALVGEPSKVLFETFNSKDSLQHIISKAQVTTELHDPRGNLVPINMHYDDNGKFEIMFTPLVIGDHHLTLLIIGNPIRNNPLIIAVHQKIGTQGARPGQFNCLTSLALSPKHHRDVFVADTMWNQRIQRITTKGVYNESYMVPYKDFSLINFDDAGNLYILFLNQKRLFTYGLGSESTLQLRYHSSLPQLQFPHGMAVNSLGQVLISDIGAHCIFVFLQTGSMVKQIGKEGKNRGEFKFPTDICLNLQDQVFVCDMDNRRVQHLDSQGRSMAIFGSETNLKQPTAVALSTEGYLLVLDRSDLSVVVFFLHSGGVVNRIDTNSVASADRLLALHDGYFLKTDNTNHCLQKFKYVEDMGWQSEDETVGHLRAGTPYSMQNGYPSSQYGTYNGSLEEQHRNHTSHYSQPTNERAMNERAMNGPLASSHYSYRHDKSSNSRYGDPRH
ncbi:uncharacterized protein [Antedon mediterranea]|uniref:uncharacterized protein n=1 Tax=Antedon mediterranea TaxID=105859 RepID=UPI003AF9B2B5